MVDDELATLHIALTEVVNQRHLFSETSYAHITRALHEKIDLLEGSVTALVKPHADEIRLVTVMFVDVVNSTLLAQQLQDEWKFMLEDIHRRLARTVEGWGGEVGQYLGDGLLCYFGARRSRSDDALRAVSCALALQQVAADARLWISARYHSDFRLRVGVATGRVVVGLIGTSHKKELLATGTATNLASRLQEICSPDQVVIDAATWRVVRDRFVTKALSPVHLRGFDDPIAHYRVVGHRQSPLLRQNTLTAGIALPFAGRSREMALLRRLSDDAMVEQAFHAMTIYGEAGVGKSRLLREALDAIDDGTYIRVHLIASYEERDLPYHPLRSFLMDLCSLPNNAALEIAQERIYHHSLEFCPNDNPELIAAVLSYLTGFSAVDLSPAVDPLAAVLRWLRGLARGEPLLIAFDDLQWADPQSLALLDYLARGLANSECLLIGTARPEFRVENPDFLGWCARSSEISLNVLSDDAACELIASVLSQIDHVPPTLSQHIFERAGGNPLFIEEFLRMLFDSGVFVRGGGGRWRTNVYAYGTLASKLPNSVMGVFQAQVDDLPELTRSAAQAAAVIGETFWLGAVSYLVGFDAQAQLDDLAQRGIITPHAPDGAQRSRFRYTLFAEVAYEMLTRPDREHYHRRTAHWLRAHKADSAEHLPDLAAHWLRGGEREQALLVYVEAVRDRAGRGLYQEALRLIEDGLASAREVPRGLALPSVAELWLWQGVALNFLRRHDEASAAGQSALRLLAELPDDQLTEARALARQVIDTAQQHSAHL